MKSKIITHFIVVAQLIILQYAITDRLNKQQNPVNAFHCTFSITLWSIAKLTLIIETMKQKTIAVQMENVLC